MPTNPLRGPGLLLVGLLLQAAPAAAERLGAYDFPFVDPLVATVVRTPDANRPALPDLEEGRNVHRFFLRGLVDRPTPPVFFFQRHGLEFGLVAQPGPAPLVFVIAGTGGAFNADINRELAQVLFAQGYHVIGLPNPTHPNFMVNASTTGVPGRIGDDAADLYRAMRAAHALVRDRIAVTGFHLTGYSLGATYAAFLAQIDSHERAFDFGRVLLLNPSVSVFASVGLVDEMLDIHEQRDPTAIRSFVQNVLDAFGRRVAVGEPVEFAGDFIYRAYAELELAANDVEKLIGLAFRLSAANLAFTADVLAGTGVLVEPDARLTATSSLTDIYLRAQAMSFTEYFHELYTPYFVNALPGMTEEQLIADADLRAIEPFLRAAGHIGLLTNEDDIILRPQDLAFLEDVFAGRAAIYPTGGHCGNYLQRDVVERIGAFFRIPVLVQ